MIEIPENILSSMRALADAIEAAGDRAGALAEVHGGIDSLSGRAHSIEDIAGNLFRIIRASRPDSIDGRWEEAWGELFSALIGMIRGSDDGPAMMISLLYGLEAVPGKASGERVLCINPGSTSTKLALYDGLELEAEEEVHLPPDYEDGIDARTAAIVAWVENVSGGGGAITGIACRGGFVKPVPCGTYIVCDEMTADLGDPKIDHASNMAIPIGTKLRERLGGDGIMVTTTDPVASDEMSIGSRLTGIRKLLRDGTGAHYLNHNAVHGAVCSILGLLPDGLTTVGAHMGGGMSVLRHSRGRVCDLENAFAGIPSANRSGNIPLDILIGAIDAGEMSIPELKRYLFGQGGLIDLAGTNDFKALMHFRDSGAVIEQRNKIELVLDFMARSIAGAVMKLSAEERKTDLAILTGGLARNDEFNGRIRKKLLPYFPVITIPGSLEHEALVAGHMRARFKPDSLLDYVRERDGLKLRREAERDLIDTEVFVHPHLRRKENAPARSLDDLIQLARVMVAKYRAPKIAIVGAENEEAVVAAKQANEEGRYPVAKFLLVGDFYEINRLAWEYDITVDGDNYTIIDAEDPVERAVELLDSREADLLMKGGVKTAEIMGGAIRYLKRSGRMRKGRVYSHVGVFQIPNYPRLLLVTDAALIPSPDQETKKKILENALTVASYLNINVPRVAVISAVEVASPSVESSMLAAELASHYAGRTDCVIEGPLSLDVAMSPAAAAEKKYRGKIKGNADILLMPDIEAGNVVYKSLTVSSGAYLAGAIVGAGVPIVLTSRGDSARSKLSSICLASLVAMKQGMLDRRS